MKIFPAIDLFEGKAVRLYKGDYAQMTVYSDRPAELASAFREAGAEQLHLVDLEGAKLGRPANEQTIRQIADVFGGFVELGGGIRDMQTVEEYLSLGISRVILGTAAVTDPGFLCEALARFGERVAVGVDIKDGYVAIEGWTEKSGLRTEDFFRDMQALGVRAVICTDISRDGAMQGANCELYRMLGEKFDIDIIASGGVSSIGDVEALAAMGLYGAIIGKAYYIGAVDLRRAIEVAQ